MDRNLAPGQPKWKHRRAKRHSVAPALCWPRSNFTRPPLGKPLPARHTLKRRPKRGHRRAGGSIIVAVVPAACATMINVYVAQMRAGPLVAAGGRDLVALRAERRAAAEEERMADVIRLCKPAEELKLSGFPWRPANWLRLRRLQTSSRAPEAAARGGTQLGAWQDCLKRAFVRAGSWPDKTASLAWSCLGHPLGRGACLEGGGKSRRWWSVGGDWSARICGARSLFISARDRQLHSNERQTGARAASGPLSAPFRYALVACWGRLHSLGQRRPSFDRRLLLSVRLAG